MSKILFVELIVSARPALGWSCSEPCERVEHQGRPDRRCQIVFALYCVWCNSHPNPNPCCFYFWACQVNGSCNVNWTNYFPKGDGPASSLLATTGRMLAYFVVLFPAMDVTSVYPLNVMVRPSSAGIWLCTNTQIVNLRKTCAQLPSVCTVIVDVNMYVYLK